MRDPRRGPAVSEPTVPDEWMRLGQTVPPPREWEVEGRRQHTRSFRRSLALSGAASRRPLSPFRQAHRAVRGRAVLLGFLRKPWTEVEGGARGGVVAGPGLSALRGRPRRREAARVRTCGDGRVCRGAVKVAPLARRGPSAHTFLILWGSERLSPRCDGERVGVCVWLAAEGARARPPPRPVWTLHGRARPHTSPLPPVLLASRHDV